MADKIRVLVIEPKKVPRVEFIENELKAMQSIVGGHLEVVRPPRHRDDDVVAICNEEGKLRGLEPCRAMRLENGVVWDILVGPLIILRAPAFAEEFEGLTDEQVEKWMSLVEF